jgi:hypothetical protein
MNDADLPAAVAASRRYEDLLSFSFLLIYQQYINYCLPLGRSKLKWCWVASTNNLCLCVKDRGAHLPILLSLARPTWPAAECTRGVPFLLAFVVTRFMHS